MWRIQLLSKKQDVNKNEKADRLYCDTIMTRLVNLLRLNALVRK